MASRFSLHSTAGCHCVEQDCESQERDAGQIQSYEANEKPNGDGTWYENQEVPSFRGESLV